MSTFSKTSEQRLSACHPDLQRLFREVLQIHDCTIIYGPRTVEEQTRLVAQGLSRTMDSRHLVQPDGYSHAVDAAPYPIDWKNTKRFYYFAGLVMAAAHKLGINIRWGGDWDQDNDLDDQTFMDLVHFELRK